MSELNAAAIKKLKVGELKAELSKRNLSILGKKEELASRLLTVINQGLLKPKSDEDRDAAMADSIDLPEDAEGEPINARHEEENAKEACFNDSFFKFLDGVSTPPRRPLFSAATKTLDKSPCMPDRSVQSPPADIYISFERLAKSVVELQSLLQIERSTNIALLEENFSLKLKLGHGVSADGKVNNSEKTKEPTSIVSKENAPLKSPIVYESLEIVENNNRATKKIKRKGKQKKKSKEISHNEVNEKHDATTVPVQTTTAPPAPESVVCAAPQSTESASASLNETQSQEISRNDASQMSQRDDDQNNIWPKNTVLIAGDSMVGNINETTLSRRYHTKVRCFRGSTIKDMHDYLKPLIKKKPSKIILMVGTNDLDRLSANQMVIGIKSPIDMIQKSLPNCHVIVSEIIRRADKKHLNGKVNEFNRALKTMNIDILRQQNITERHLGRKGLHLNPKGDSQLAMNVIDKIRSFSY